MKINRTEWHSLCSYQLCIPAFGEMRKAGTEASFGLGWGMPLRRSRLKTVGERSNNMPKTTSKVKVRVVQEKDLLHAPEIAVFLACRRMVNELRTLAWAFNAQEISKSAFMNRCKTILGELNEAADATERFDIVLPVMDYGRFSPFFWRWFNWWDDYLRELTPKQVGQVEKLARDQKPALEEYRPREHWVRYRHGAAFTLVML